MRGCLRHISDYLVGGWVSEGDPHVCFAVHELSVDVQLGGPGALWQRTHSEKAS